jgi:hypothetical protein
MLRIINKSEKKNTNKRDLYYYIRFCCMGVTFIFGHVIYEPNSVKTDILFFCFSFRHSGRHSVNY